MKTETFEFKASDEHPVFVYAWLPETAPRGVIHIAHGMGEHAKRYEWVASKLVDQGFAVFADDHRGHGNTADTLGRFGPDGWNRTIKDLAEMIASHQVRFPGVPTIFFGHSMGAMLAQQYIATLGDTIDAVVLSGSPGFTGWLQGFVTKLIVRFECWRKGPEGDSPLLQSLLFGAANKAFEDEVPEPSGYEWLSRDPEQVRLYLEDPFCGFVPCPGSLRDLSEGATWTQSNEAINNIPAGLPMLAFSGDADPVHNKLKNFNRMIAAFEGHGLKPEKKLYPGGRHEMLNETNRDEVIDDVVVWLNRQFK
jgi:alpha-beta hydrolase superfamily lysophospholipase